jgi:hypothetical protein
MMVVGPPFWVYGFAAFLLSKKEKENNAVNQWMRTFGYS